MLSLSYCEHSACLQESLLLYSILNEGLMKCFYLLIPRILLLGYYMRGTPLKRIREITRKRDSYNARQMAGTYFAYLVPGYINSRDSSGIEMKCIGDKQQEQNCVYALGSCADILFFRQDNGCCPCLQVFTVVSG